MIWGGERKAKTSSGGWHSPNRVLLGKFHKTKDEEGPRYSRAGSVQLGHQLSGSRYKSPGEVWSCGRLASGAKIRQECCPQGGQAVGTMNSTFCRTNTMCKAGVALHGH